MSCEKLGNFRDTISKSGSIINKKNEKIVLKDLSV
ncbi:hypothetical protein MCBB_1065 [Methanobacterium congolense]|uniref:Uncharacterized protein n=1 Tax=Methanobacterium congolense TaxID=118062 RepID=A0A1D3L1S0_9EURY|nr:hypothetical protein MCBB_1065 [Methanobacterium congolense]